ncbi:hypothetical protein F511_42966 [Dorcoceras hygrometricum]|uniref:Uncharacterized protein n=1 Tax=Dorcoceras hygrometricum TaxID=472368 RepID=A0A2Z6ZZ07_9LAMI|nr:hypothetical protein F511_42966 [Dorcoceras hygrometricum]
MVSGSGHAGLPSAQGSWSSISASTSSAPNKRNCGRYRQSGPRPDKRLLRHPALEGMTRSARTDSPRRIGRKQFSGEEGGGGGGAHGGGGGGLREDRGGGCEA